MTIKLIAAAGAGLIAMLSTGAALASPALTLTAQPLLNGPSIAGYAKLADLAAGTHVNVVWCGMHDKWCLIDEHNLMGWIPLADLGKVGGGVLTDADNLGLAAGHGTPGAGSPSAKEILAIQQAPQQAPAGGTLLGVHPVGVFSKN